MDSIAQGIYYIKQTPSCAIFTATLFWNSAGHLLHKTNPDLSYFELSYVFWEHNDSVGRGTTVYFLKSVLKVLNLDFYKLHPISVFELIFLIFLLKCIEKFVRTMRWKRVPKIIIHSCIHAKMSSILPWKSQVEVW